MLALLDAPDSELHANSALPALPGYYIERLIGSGGGGDVYLARRDSSDRPVALKLIRLPGFDGVGSKKRSNSLDRAFRELHLLEETRLSCTPRLLDYGMHEGRLFIAVEFIEGEPLDKHCEQRALSLKQRAELLARAADAAQMLHERALIHRDLKPSNILVTPQGDVMLIDLGIAAMTARADAATLTEEGCPIGTPAFMAPEQARGDRAAISTRSDVYALGATAYALLAGATPHDTDTSLADAIRKVSFDPPRDPRELNPHLPKPLVAVLSKAVSPRPADRYATVGDFAADMRRWIRGEAVEAVAPGLLRRAVRWAGRHPKTASAISAIVVFACTVLGVWVVTLVARRADVSLKLPPHSSTAVLCDAGDIPIRRWRSSNEINGRGDIVRLCPTERGWTAPYAVVARLSKDLDEPWRSGRVCTHLVQTVGTRLVPLWTSPQTAEDGLVAPRLTERDGSPYAEQTENPIFGAALLEVADVFPDEPGEELVVSYAYHDQPGAIIIHSLSGEHLYEAWFFGGIAHARWLPETKILVLAGNDNDLKWDQVGAMLGEGPEFAAGVQTYNPNVLLAIRPRLRQRAGMLFNRRTLFPEPDHSIQVLWRWWLWPPRGYRRDSLHIAALGPPQSPAAAFAVTINPGSEPNSAVRAGGITVEFNSGGDVVDHHASDAYLALLREPGRGVRLGVGELPTVDQVRGAWVKEMPPKP